MKTNSEWKRTHMEKKTVKRVHNLVYILIGVATALAALNLYQIKDLI